MANLELKNIERSDYYYREAIKTLRTNLQFCGSSVKVIMFTSTMPSEGKSATAFATAVSMSDIHKKVLFIDADIRKSVMVKTHEISGRNAGLSQYLSGQTTMEEIVHTTNVENLDVSSRDHIPRTRRSFSKIQRSRHCSTGREKSTITLLSIHRR